MKRRPCFDEERRRIYGEYLEMPGLKLTPEQASRFWHLSASDAEALLDSLVQAGALLRTRDGAYLFAGRTPPDSSLR